MTGMDFKLGGEKDDQGVEIPAIEVVKYIQKSDGTRIRAERVTDLGISVYYNKNADPNGVIDVGTNAPISPEDLNRLTGTKPESWFTTR